MKFKSYIIYTLFLCLLSSCTDTSCPLNNVVRCYYGFYDSPTGKSINCSDTLTAVANDSILINRLYNQQAFSLPMSFALSCDSLLFYLHTPDGVDTINIKVYHTNQPYTASLECGTSFFHKITKVEWKGSMVPSFVDSVIINKPDVNYDQVENLKIYLADI